MEMSGVMADMDEKKREKVNDFRARLAHMNSTLDELKIEDEELDKEIEEKIIACFIH